MHAGAAELDGAHPLFELECGRISEERFSSCSRPTWQPMHRLAARSMHRFSELYFDAAAAERSR